MLVVVRLLILSLLAIVPWYYGTAVWTAQYYFMMYAAAVCVIAFAVLVWRTVHKSTTPSQTDKLKLLPPLPFYIFIVVGFWSFLQTLPIYSIEGGDSGPNTIRIQRFFLGESIPSVAERLKIDQVSSDKRTDNESPRASFVPSDLKEHKLAWSIEPLHTKAGVGMVFLVAALIWIGNAYFSSSQGLVYILSAVTLVGVAVGMFGIASLLDFRPENFLGLGKASSFGPFVSRNSGGCYMNICLAAAMGLTTVAFSLGRRKRSDQRYNTMSDTRWEQFLSQVEMSVGQLTTFQIASVIATAVLIASVVSSASRGASISCAITILAVFLMSTGRGMTFGRVAVAITVLVVGASFLFWFELDDHLRDRLQNSLWEDDSDKGRRLIWSVAAQAAGFFFTTGSGLGTFHFAHLPFQTRPVNIWFYNAESLYWETLVDLGWVGAISILGMLATFIYVLYPKSADYSDDRNSNRLGAARVTALAMLLSVGVHSFFDFSMIYPALFVTAALLFGAIYGSNAQEFQLRKSSSSKSSSRRRLRDISRDPSTEKFQQTDVNLASSTATAQNNVESVAAPVVKYQLERTESLRSIQNLTPPSATTTFISIATAVCLMLTTCAFTIYSLPSLGLMSRGDLMRQFIGRQLKLPADERASNRSVLLAGIWGDSDKPDDCPDALRNLALSLVEDYQRVRSDSLQETYRLTKREADAMSTLSVSHLSLKTNVSDPNAIDTFFISPSQKERWTKARSLFQRALIQSPLDWRISYTLYLLSYDLPDEQLIDLNRRLGVLSYHRPGHLLQLALIAKFTNQEQDSMKHFNAAIEGRSSLAPRIAKLLATWYPDSEIPLDIFQDEPGQLLQILSVFPEDKFPSTHERVVQRATAAAESLPRVDVNRSLYLSAIARNEGNLELALEHLQEASQRRMNDVQIRFEVVALAIQLDRLEVAEDELLNLQFLAKDDPRLSSYQTALENAKTKRNPTTN